MILISGILLVLIFIALCILCFIIDNMHKLGAFFCGIFGGLIFSLAISCFVCYFVPAITPMDVYQGKTTLEYKVVDGVKVDSIVVWKEDL